MDHDLIAAKDDLEISKILNRLLRRQIYLITISTIITQCLLNRLLSSAAVSHIQQFSTLQIIQRRNFACVGAILLPHNRPACPMIRGTRQTFCFFKSRFNIAVASLFVNTPFLLLIDYYHFRLLTLSDMKRNFNNAYLRTDKRAFLGRVIANVQICVCVLAICVCSHAFPDNSGNVSNFDLFFTYFPF